MYYIRDGLKLPWLGSLFAFFLMIEIAPSIATQSASFVQSAETIKIAPIVSGILDFTLAGVIVTNMIGVLLLRKEVKKESDSFFNNKELMNK